MLSTYRTGHKALYSSDEANSIIPLLNMSSLVRVSHYLRDGLDDLELVGFQFSADKVKGTLDVILLKPS